jgi:hypothetical protein
VEELLDPPPPLGRQGVVAHEARPARRERDGPLTLRA